MELDAVLSSIHECGPRWAALAETNNRNRRIDAGTAEELRQIGVHRLVQPVAYGGAQDSIESHTRVVSAIAEYCMSSSWCAAVWSGHNWMASHFSPEVQDELWAQPDRLLSASIVPKTPFRADGDDLIVQGRFGFASGCDAADWFGVGGVVPDVGPVICLLPRNDATIDQDSWDVSGLAGTGSKDLVIDEPLRVPGHRVLYSMGAADRQAPGQLHHRSALYHAPFRATAALVLAAPVIGAAKAALRRFQERLDSHVIVARQGSQRSDPAAGMRLAEASAEINAADLVLLDASARLDQLGADEVPDPERTGSVVRDTGYSVRLAARGVDRLYEASGGSALSRDEPMQRIWRDVHAARLHAILTWDGAAATYAAAALG